MSSEPERGSRKTRIPIAEAARPALPKPDWLRVRAVAPTPATRRLQEIVRTHGLSTVCREAYCPNMGECFENGTATFLIMGSICTRRCPFCDVAHGRPLPLDPNEPENLAQAVREMQLRYAVITSVDRDDLRDGGAGHYAACVTALRRAVPGIEVEILVPDFRGRQEKALDILSAAPPDVFNHNVETVPSLYRSSRPGASYEVSLTLLEEFKRAVPSTLTKSGLMLGLGETDDEVMQVLEDLRRHQVDIVTIGQYLAPSSGHLPVRRYVSPQDFARWQERALSLGFQDAVCGVFVRSSYQAHRHGPAALATHS